MGEGAPELTAEPIELTAELIVDSAVPRHPVISPDGAWVAYVVTTWAEPASSALWVAAAG